MLIRRAARSCAAVFLVAVALAGCRSAPDVAAYVGDEQITVAELESAVGDRLADEDVAASAVGRDDELTRAVLGLLLEGAVHDAAAERYGVQVTDREVNRRIEELLGGDDPQAVYDQLAQQGVSRADVRENVRQQLVRREIAEAEGGAEALDTAALRARYEEVREELAQLEFGYITVPDQAAADELVAQLTADPSAYAELAAGFPGPYTLPTLERRAAEELPSALAGQFAAAAPGTAFAVPVPEAGGVVVGFRAGTVYPSFEELRPQLESEAFGAVEAAVQPLLDEVRADLGITVNPRYGVLDEGRLAPPGDGGVVRILEEPAAASQLRVPSAD
ncbi:SurA N-terminal domain-containing protein [Blastococcus capsensis]|uniref:SurA N-terminal domain-containing protein n=1 Tax=Blastococcus capsensis TaxID=1564163 RepID=UPI0025407374|nr:SurA N-terminal domain-containing protein [Blastococcus capsensis]MDK3258698.1 SurA N-terminal domain-containing protein [Blastococcus capsensis]